MVRDRALVLVAGGHGEIRSGIRSLLEVCGFRVIEARTGLDALGWCRTGAVDLAVLDVQMPQLGGMDVLRLIRQDRSDSDLPVILVSRDGTAGVVDGMTFGAQDCIGWPGEPVEVLARVESALHMRVSEGD